jgi:hypothetical protein
MTHPYSIYVWQPTQVPGDKDMWIEPLQVYTGQYAVYIAGLIHKDTHAVIKVVRYGLNIAYFPDAHAVEQVERQITREKQNLPRWISR